MRAEVLGEVRLLSSEETLSMPGGRVGRLLSWFLLRPNEDHPVATLVGVVWPEGVPNAEAGRRRLHLTVNRLRRLLDDGDETGLSIVTIDDGYRLMANGSALDRIEFEEWAEKADRGETEAARAGLALWRGAPYVGVARLADTPHQVRHLEATRRRLEQVRDRQLGAWSLRDRFARTKFMRPDTGSVRQMLERPRLLERAGRIGEVSVLAVTAPGGYGKSVFLGQWSDAQTAPVAWVTLDSDESDPVRFWSAVFHAIAHTEAFDLSDVPRIVPGSPAFVMALMDTLSRSGGPLGLVLDDVHEVDNPDLIQRLRMYLAVFPDWLTVALGSRDPLELDEGEVTGRLAVMTHADLRFEPLEIDALLELDRTDLEEEAKANLIRVTGGWPVAVTYLSRSGGAIDEAHGPSSTIEEYVLDEVLSGLPDAVRTFLLHTSHLDRFNPELCDAVTETSGSAEVLEWLRGRGLFVIGGGSDLGWYRYHALVADALRGRAESDPAAVRDRLGRAARWCMAHGFDEEALQYAISGFENQVVTALAGSVLSDIAGRGEMYTVERILRRLEPEVVAGNRRAHDTAMFLVAALLDPPAAERWVESRHDPSVGVDVPLILVRIMQHLVRGRARVALELGSDAGAVVDEYFERHPNAGDFKAAVDATLSAVRLCARMMLREVDHGDGIVEVVAEQVRRQAPLISPRVLGEWAFTAYLEGDSEQALALLDRLEPVLAAMDGRSAELGAGRALVTRALLESDSTDDPTTQMELTGRLLDMVPSYESRGWRTDLIPVLLALHVTTYRQGDLLSAAGHAAHADIVLGMCTEVPLLKWARERLYMGVGRRDREWPDPARGGFARGHRDILDGLDRGLTYAEIARETGMTLPAVRHGVRTLYSRLGVHTRLEAVAIAGHAGRSQEFELDHRSLSALDT